MEETKLSLSPEEWAIVADPEIILTKNAVLHKIKMSLEAVYRQQLNYVELHAASLPAGLFTNSGKISKGENYNGLPYLILDYPRDFSRGHIFAIRSMFWWGKQVSVTLHITGAWKDHFMLKLAERLELLKKESFYLSWSGNEWDHDISSSNYIPFCEIEAREWTRLLKAAAFIKIASYAPIAELALAPEVWQKAFRRFIDLLR